MFIQYLDYLSPPIGIYYKGGLTHPSIVSGILSIISIIIIIYLGVYFSIDLLKRRNPNTFYYNSYVPDAGKFEFNSSSLFHFINMAVINKGKFIYQSIDFTIINIVGTEASFGNYLASLENGSFSILTHWLYGICNKDIHGKGVEKLITYEFFEQSLCINKYYSADDNKYYDIGDPNFKYPFIAYGTNNENNKNYNIFVHRCHNKIISGILGNNSQCKNSDNIISISDINQTNIINLYFINNNINVLNYYNTFSKFFYRIETVVRKGKYILDDININPVNVKTHDGVAIEHINNEISYAFDRNDISISDMDDKEDIFICYSFYLKNIMYYYERSYKKIQDVISDIGGFFQIINIIAVYLNKIYNNYIILSDTDKLLHSLIKSEKNKHIMDSKNYQLKKKSKKKSNNNASRNINSSTKTKDSLINEKEKNNVKKNKSDNDIYRSDINLKNKLKGLNKNFYDLQPNSKKKRDVKNYVNLISHGLIKEEKNFWNYLLYIIPFKNKKNLYFSFYEEFRMKIISEEHFMRNHLNIYNLLKVTEKKRITKQTSYHLKNLVNIL